MFDTNEVQAIIANKFDNIARKMTIKLYKTLVLATPQQDEGRLLNHLG